MKGIADLQEQLEELQDLVADLQQPLLRASHVTDLDLRKKELEVEALEAKASIEPLEVRKKEADAELAEHKLAQELAEAKANAGFRSQAIKAAVGCIFLGIVGAVLRPH